MISSSSSKGQFNNYLIIPVFLFAFGIMTIFGFYMFQESMSAIQNTSIYNPTSMDAVVSGYESGILVLDYVIVLILIVLIIGLAVSSFKIKTHPAYFIVVLLLAPFLGFVSYILNYVFQEIVGHSTFSSVLIYFPKTLIIGTNLHWVSLIAVVVGSISLYAKRGDQDDFQGGGAGLQ